MRERRLGRRKDDRELWGGGRCERNEGRMGLRMDRGMASGRRGRTSG